MIVLDGKATAGKIKSCIAGEVRGFGRAPRLAIVIVGENKISAKYVLLKEAFARDVGIETRRYEFPATISTNQLRAHMKDIVHETRNDGVIVQLPLPRGVDTQSVLNAIVPEKDVDLLSARAAGDYQVGKSQIRPPVVGAIEELFREYGISISGKKTVLIGYGRLVGQPLSIWLARTGAKLSIIGAEEHFDIEFLKRADIVISGAGKPKLITGELIQEGAVVVDVGVSDVAGALVGDVDVDSIKERASYATPEKGGVGPMTVAILFENLIKLLEARR